MLSASGLAIAKLCEQPDCPLKWDWVSLIMVLPSRQNSRVKELNEQDRTPLPPAPRQPWGFGPAAQGTAGNAWRHSWMSSRRGMLLASSG